MMTRTATANEFVCDCCGRPIVSFPWRNPPPTRCCLCQWLDEYVTDPIERAAIMRQVEPPAGAANG